MGSDLPKMLIPVLGRPLLYWTLKNLESCSAIHSIVLVVPSDYHSLFQKKVHRWHFKKIFAIVKGGEERIDSTRNGLIPIPAENQWIGIHDGARPFVSSPLIKKCFESAKKYGAAILAVPCKETVKVVQPGSFVIKKTIPRDQCWSAQTPQVFRRDIVEKMHRSKFPLTKKTVQDRFTDDASIAESLGFKVQIVPGSYKNIKITTSEDLVVAKSILEKREWLESA